MSGFTLIDSDFQLEKGLEKLRKVRHYLIESLYV